MAAGGDLPHDLYTFVIEAALGLEHGFWGCVADGATFSSFGRRPTAPGKTVIARHSADLDAAEARVNEIYFAWRRGKPTELDAELDAMLARWRAVPQDGELTVDWPAAASGDRRTERPADRSGRLSRGPRPGGGR